MKESGGILGARVTGTLRPLSRSVLGQHYEAVVLMRDAAAEKAERIFTRELRAAVLTEKALRERQRSESLKWKIARNHALGNRGVLGWIARQLDLGSASNVSLFDSAEKPF